MDMAQKQEIFTLVGGRVRIRRGIYNPTADAVWLAAAGGDVRARTALDVGVGSGGAAMCLGVHRPGIRITGVDISREMLDACADNAALNNCDIELVHADIQTWKTDRTFDLVITNPPYFTGTPARHNAHHNADLGAWMTRAAARVRPHGTLCAIVDAARMADAVAAIAARCGDIMILPLFGANKNVAERVIIRARAGTRGPTRMHAGMPMNCDAVLRDGLTIDAALDTLGQK